ncbi:unnamed protein product, partial [Polarella glacialis]
IESAVTQHKLDNAVKNRWINAMRKRSSSFREDMKTLNDVMRAARHPKGALSLKLREMENNSFTARSYSPLGPTPAEREDLAKAAKAPKGPDAPRDTPREDSRDRRGGSRDRRRRSRSRSRRRERD